MRIGDLSPWPGARKKRKRVGRGPGSGHGKTSTRGHKGQKARSGGSPSIWSEGGQMPLQRRVPKRGFFNRFGTVYQVVNLEEIARKVDAGGEIDPESMDKLGMICRADAPVKILATGEIDKAVTVRANAFSQAAKDKIEKAGGKAETIT